MPSVPSANRNVGRCHSLRRVPSLDGSEMGLQACTTPERLRALYNELGWKGSANARAFHLAAKRWLELHHAGRCPVVSDAE